MKTKINNKNKKNRQKDKKILLTFLLLTIRISFPMGLRRLTDNIFSNLMVSFLCNIVSAMAGWFILNSCNIAGKWFMESPHLTKVKQSNKEIIRDIWISYVFHDFLYSVATFSIRNKTEEESIFLEAKCLQGDK